MNPALPSDPPGVPAAGPQRPGRDPSGPKGGAADGARDAPGGVRHAILPAAGRGTRFLPWSKAVPKELLPIGELPLIHHVAAEAVAAGLTEILLVIAPGKEAIRRYFEPDPELERWLRREGQEHRLDSLRRLQESARFHPVVQPEPRGLGDAVRCAADTIPGLPFAVLLADTMIRGPSPLPAMLRDLERSGRGSVAVQPVPPERAVRYGVCGGRETAPRVYRLDSMAEKPDAAALPLMRLLDGRRTPMAFAARYVFPAALAPILRATPPGRNGEIQLTDAMNRLLQAQGFHAHRLKGARLDLGTPEGLREALAPQPLPIPGNTP